MRSVCAPSISIHFSPLKCDTSILGFDRTAGVSSSSDSSRAVIAAVFRSGATLRTGSGSDEKGVNVFEDVEVTPCSANGLMIVDVDAIGVALA